jgi:hypothetical protein
MGQRDSQHFILSLDPRRIALLKAESHDPAGQKATAQALGP